MKTIRPPSPANDFRMLISAFEYAVVGFQRKMALIFEGIGVIEAARSSTWVRLKPAEVKTAFKVSWLAWPHSVGAQRDWCPRCIMTPVWVVRGPVPVNCTRLRKKAALFG